jgi:hypothetical protein
LRQRSRPSNLDSKKFNKFKKKALAATWDDSSDSSSDEDVKEENQNAYMCFMAHEDEVSDNLELVDAFNELLENFKRLKASHRFLKNENDRLNFDLVTSNSSHVNELTELKDKLLLENDSLTKENIFLKNECNSLNARISDLDSSISSLRSKYEIIFSNVSKFNKGKENLTNLLSFQKPAHDRLGIGFVKSRPHTHVSHVSRYGHHAYLYANSSRSKHVRNACDNSIRNRSQSSIPSIFMWIPKNVSMHVRNKYVLDFKQNICNSDNYICVDKGKPNSKWIWSPKG